ncbi:MAG: restriction endonuclease [Candidatus Thiodiazotropha endolucinida]
MGNLFYNGFIVRAYVQILYCRKSDQDFRDRLLGKIASDYRHDPIIDPDYACLRNVEWLGEVDRDMLSVAAKNSLGAISTLFLVPNEFAREIEAVKEGKLPATAEEEETTEEKLIFADIEDRALQFIQDRVNRLDWEQMQDLVAGLLRAMGYKTRVSAPGADRGKDIVASPNGFGFENPRIVVEVKHRNGAMGSQQIRSFLGGRHPEDKGLYVCTGGFTKDARYEAERATIPLMLMDLSELVLALMDNYSKLDIETQRLVPLKMIYLPV